MREDRRQRCGKSETVGQHIFGAGLSEFFAEPLVAIENLADDCFGAWSIDVSFFHRGSGRKPTAFVHILFHLRKVGWEVFLHETVAIGAAEVEDVVRILFEQLEIILHSLADVFVDNLGIFPSPFRVQVGVPDDVQRRLLGEVRFIRILR